MSQHPQPADADADASAHAQPDTPGFEPVIARNINALLETRQRKEAGLNLEERVADAITRFAGSMKFVYLHIVLFVFWIAWNTLPLPIHKFDPQLIVLAMWASVESIFLSTFILISQNRQTKDSDRRSDLDLQINLLTEHELSRLIALVVKMADQMGIKAEGDPALSMAQRDIQPEHVLDQIETSQRRLNGTQSNS